MNIVILRNDLVVVESNSLNGECDSSPPHCFLLMVFNPIQLKKLQAELALQLLLHASWALFCTITHAFAYISMLSDVLPIISSPSRICTTIIFLEHCLTTLLFFFVFVFLFPSSWKTLPLKKQKKNMSVNI